MLNRRYSELENKTEEASVSVRAGKTEVMDAQGMEAGARTTSRSSAASETTAAAEAGATVGARAAAEATALAEASAAVVELQPYLYWAFGRAAHEGRGRAGAHAGEALVGCTGTCWVLGSEADVPDNAVPTTISRGDKLEAGAIANVLLDFTYEGCAVLVRDAGRFRHGFSGSEEVRQGCDGEGAERRIVAPRSALRGIAAVFALGEARCGGGGQKRRLEEAKRVVGSFLELPEQLRTPASFRALAEDRGLLPQGRAGVPAELQSAFAVLSRLLALAEENARLLPAMPDGTPTMAGELYQVGYRLCRMRLLGARAGLSETVEVIEMIRFVARRARAFLREEDRRRGEELIADMEAFAQAAFAALAGGAGDPLAIASRAWGDEQPTMFEVGDVGQLLCASFYAGIASGAKPKRCGECRRWFLSRASAERYCMRVPPLCHAPCRQMHVGRSRGSVKQGVRSALASRRGTCERRGNAGAAYFDVLLEFLGAAHAAAYWKLDPSVKERWYAALRAQPYAAAFDAGVRLCRWKTRGCGDEELFPVVVRRGSHAQVVFSRDVFAVQLAAALTASLGAEGNLRSRFVREACAKVGADVRFAEACLVAADDAFPGIDCEVPLPEDAAHLDSMLPGAGAAAERADVRGEVQR